MNFINAKILITGGLGFIGSNLAIRLVELGADVSLVDSLIPEYGGNLCNIEIFPPLNSCTDASSICPCI